MESLGRLIPAPRGQRSVPHSSTSIECAMTYVVALSFRKPKPSVPSARYLCRVVRLFLNPSPEVIPSPSARTSSTAAIFSRHCEERPALGGERRGNHFSGSHSPISDCRVGLRLLAMTGRFVCWPCRHPERSDADSCRYKARDRGPRRRTMLNVERAGRAQRSSSR